MAALSIQVPYPVFYDRDGQPLENGNIYIGVANLDPVTNPIQVYYDAALTITASQPLITSGGYVYRNGTPAQLYVNAVNFSILVNDEKNLLVYSFPDGTGIAAQPPASSVTFTGFNGQTGFVSDLGQSDGSDWIGFTPDGTGAVPRTAQNKMRDTISIKDFGAVGNGVADDTAALFAMRNALIAEDPDAQWYIKGSGGNYRFANNKWLCGLSNVDIDLEGGSLTYTSTSSANFDAVSFFGNAWIFSGPTSDAYGAGIAKVDALPINTVAVAETVVTLTTSGAASLFAVGEPIIIGGWETQSAGYPPNLSVFEFNRVVSINTGTNQLTVYPLRNSYKSTWPTVTTGGPNPVRGPAQVIKMLNRASLAPGVTWPNMMQNFSLKNGTIAGLQAATNFQMPVAERCNIENIKFKVLNVYGLTAEHLTFDRCISYNQELELDKLIDHVSITNCTFPVLSSAAGVQKLSVDSSTIHGRFDVAPFSLTVRDSIIGPRFSTSTSITTTVSGKATFDNCTLLNGNTGGGDAYLTYGDFTQTTYTPTSISGNDLVFATYPDLRPNSYLMKTDGSVYGRIVDISGSGPYTVSVLWSGSGPATGSAFYNFIAPRISVDNTSDQFKYVGGIMNAFVGIETLGSPRASTIIDKFMVPTMITSIEINVIAAGAGAIFVRGFGGTPTICSINTANTGLRTVTPSGATGSQAGDDLTGYTNLTSYRPRLRFDFLSTGARYTTKITATPLIDL